MAVKIKGQPIEAKPAASLTTVAIIGYIVGLVFAVWPSFAAHIPPDYQAQLPNVLAVVLGAAVAYFVPHTNRPDLLSVTPFSESELEQLRQLLQKRDIIVPSGGVTVRAQGGAGGGASEGETTVGGGSVTVVPSPGGTGKAGPGGSGNSWD